MLLQVEAAGIEPASHDAFMQASTCVAGLFAALTPYGPGSAGSTSRESVGFNFGLLASAEAVPNWRPVVKRLGRTLSTGTTYL